MWFFFKAFYAKKFIFKSWNFKNNNNDNDCYECEDGSPAELKASFIESANAFLDDVNWCNFHYKKCQFLKEIEQKFCVGPAFEDESVKEAFLQEVKDCLSSKWYVLCNKDELRDMLTEKFCDIVDDDIDPTLDPCPMGPPPNGTDVISGLVTDDDIEVADGFSATIAGNEGNDTIEGGDYADFILGNTDEDLIFGGCGNDTLFGGTENDRVFGDEGNDSINGDIGDDIVDGGVGDDIIQGGTGSDEMFGDEGEDAFVFTARSQADAALDQIMDFEAGIDTINFRGIGSGQVSAVQNGDDCEILIDGTLEIVVLQSTAASVDSAFVFE